MPSIRVDFYLLPEMHWPKVCDLLEEAYKQGQRVYVHCNDQEQAEFLDELLWTYKDDSFIPHNLQGEGPEPPPPIQIGYATAPEGFKAATLMNLSSEIPAFYNRFRQVMEIISPNEADKVQARLRYKSYKQQGCELHTRPID